MGHSTADLMNVALKLANLKEMPVDTDIIVPGNDVKKILIGIDMDTAEILLARELGCDCVVSHHPKNIHPDYADIMDHHVDKLVACGVPINKAQRVLKVQKDAVALGRHGNNSERFGSAAKLLGMPYIVVVGRGLADGVVELKVRATGQAREVKLESIVAELTAARP